MQDQVIDRLEELERKLEALNEENVRPEAMQDSRRYTELAKRHAELEEVVGAYRRFREVEDAIDDTEGLLDEADDDMQELAEEELETLRAEKEQLEERLFRLLLPKDPNDRKDVVLEVRAGTGGEEAALFAAEIFRMYQEDPKGTIAKAERNWRRIQSTAAADL